MSEKEIGKLVENINPKAKLPRHFDLWSETMQIAWLRQNQKKDRKSGG